MHKVKAHSRSHAPQFTTIYLILPDFICLYTRTHQDNFRACFQMLLALCIVHTLINVALAADLANNRNNLLIPSYVLLLSLRSSDKMPRAFSM